MRHSRNNTKYLISIISSTISALLLLEAVVWAAPNPTSIFGQTSSVQPLPAPSADSKTAADLSSLDIPWAHLTLRQTHAGTNGRQILHIQDPHSNFGGQKHLAEGLSHLMERHGIHDVFVEGADRDVTLDFLKKQIPGADWKRVAYRFLLDGRIQGEEYLNLVSELPMTLRGVEDWNLYRRSVDAYAQMAEFRKDAQAYLHRARSAVDRAKGRLYPKEVLEYEQEKIAAGGDTAKRVAAIARRAKADAAALEAYPAFESYARLLESEKAIDFRRLNEERAAAVETLRNRMDPDEWKALESSFRTASGDPAASEASVRQLVQALSRSGSPASRTELERYADLAQQIQSVDFEALIEEASALEQRWIAGRLDEDAAVLRAIDRYLELVDKAVTLRMSSREYAQWRRNRADFPGAGWTAFLNRKLMDLGYSEDWLPAGDILSRAMHGAERFYDLVRRRDRAFVKRLNAGMDADGAASAFLITGGYHTENLMRLLRREGYGYAVLTPRVEHETDTARYEKLLLTARSTLRLPSIAMEPRSADIGHLQDMAIQTVPAGSRLAAPSDSPKTSAAKIRWAERFRQGGIRAAAWLVPAAILAALFQTIATPILAAVSVPMLYSLWNGTDPLGKVQENQAALPMFDGANAASDALLQKTKRTLALSWMKNVRDAYRSAHPKDAKPGWKITAGMWTLRGLMVAGLALGGQAALAGVTIFGFTVGGWALVLSGLAVWFIPQGLAKWAATVNQLAKQAGGYQKLIWTPQAVARGGLSLVLAPFAAFWTVTVATPYHLLKGFITGLYESVVVAYLYPMAAWIWDAAAKYASGRKAEVAGFVDFVAAEALKRMPKEEAESLMRWVMQREAAPAVENKGSRFEKWSQSSAGFWAQYLYQASFAGPTVDFLKKRGGLFFAGVLAAKLLPLIFGAAAGVITVWAVTTLLMTVKMGVSVHRARQSGVPPARIVRTVLIHSAMIAAASMLFMNLLDLGAGDDWLVHTDGTSTTLAESGQTFDLLNRGTVHTPGSVMNPFTGEVLIHGSHLKINLTVHAFMSSATTLALMGLKSIPAKARARQMNAINAEIYRILREETAKASLDSDTADAAKNLASMIAKNKKFATEERMTIWRTMPMPQLASDASTKDKILAVLSKIDASRAPPAFLSEFSPSDIRELAAALEELGLPDVSRRVLRFVLEAVRMDGDQRFSLTSHDLLSRSELDLEGVLGDAAKQPAPLEQTILAQETTRFSRRILVDYPMAVFDHLTSVSTWIKVVLGVPGMQLVNLEIPLVVGLAEMTQNAFLVRLIHGIEGERDLQAAISEEEGFLKEASFADRVRAGGMLSLFNNIFNVLFASDATPSPSYAARYLVATPSDGEGDVPPAAPEFRTPDAPAAIRTVPEMDGPPAQEPTAAEPATPRTPDPLAGQDFDEWFRQLEDKAKTFEPTSQYPLDWHAQIKKWERDVRQEAEFKFGSRDQNSTVEPDDWKRLDTLIAAEDREWLLKIADAVRGMSDPGSDRVKLKEWKDRIAEIDRLIAEVRKEQEEDKSDQAPTLTSSELREGQPGYVSEDVRRRALELYSEQLNQWAGLKDGWSAVPARSFFEHPLALGKIHVLARDPSHEHVMPEPPFALNAADQEFFAQVVDAYVRSRTAWHEAAGLKETEENTERRKAEFAKKFAYNHFYTAPVNVLPEDLLPLEGREAAPAMVAKFTQLLKKMELLRTLDFYLSNNATVDHSTIPAELLPAGDFTDGIPMADVLKDIFEARAANPKPLSVPLDQRRAQAHEALADRYAPDFEPHKPKVITSQTELSRYDSLYQSYEQLYLRRHGKVIGDTLRDTAPENPVQHLKHPGAMSWLRQDLTLQHRPATAAQEATLPPYGAYAKMDAASLPYGKEFIEAYERYLRSNPALLRQYRLESFADDKVPNWVPDNLKASGIQDLPGVIKILRANAGRQDLPEEARERQAYAADLLEQLQNRRSPLYRETAVWLGSREQSELPVLTHWLEERMMTNYLKQTALLGPGFIENPEGRFAPVGLQEMYRVELTGADVRLRGQPIYPGYMTLYERIYEIMLRDSKAPATNPFEFGGVRRLDPANDIRSNPLLPLGSPRVHGNEFLAKTANEAVPQIVNWLDRWRTISGKAQHAVNLEENVIRLGSDTLAILPTWQALRVFEELGLSHADAVRWMQAAQPLAPAVDPLELPVTEADLPQPLGSAEKERRDALTSIYLRVLEDAKRGDARSADDLKRYRDYVERQSALGHAFRANEGPRAAVIGPQRAHTVWLDELGRAVLAGPDMDKVQPDRRASLFDRGIDFTGADDTRMRLIRQVDGMFVPGHGMDPIAFDGNNYPIRMLALGVPPASLVGTGESGPLMAFKLGVDKLSPRTKQSLDNIFGAHQRLNIEGKPFTASDFEDWDGRLGEIAGYGSDRLADGTTRPYVWVIRPQFAFGGAMNDGMYALAMADVSSMSHYEPQDLLYFRGALFRPLLISQDRAGEQDPQAGQLVWGTGSIVARYGVNDRRQNLPFIDWNSSEELVASLRARYGTERHGFVARTVQISHDPAINRYQRAYVQTSRQAIAEYEAALMDFQASGGRPLNDGNVWSFVDKKGVRWVRGLGIEDVEEERRMKRLEYLMMARDAASSAEGIYAERLTAIDTLVQILKDEGFEAMGEGKYADVVRLYEAVLGLDPDNHGVKLLATYAAARLPADSQDKRLLLDLLSRHGIDTEAAMAEILNKEAAGQIQTGSLSFALNLLDQSIRMEPGIAHSWVLLGHTYEKLNLKPIALMVYRAGGALGSSEGVQNENRVFADLGFDFDPMHGRIKPNQWNIDERTDASGLHERIQAELAQIAKLDNQSPDPNTISRIVNLLNQQEDGRGVWLELAKRLERHGHRPAALAVARALTVRHGQISRDLTTVDLRLRQDAHGVMARSVQRMDATGFAPQQRDKLIPQEVLQQLRAPDPAQPQPAAARMAEPEKALLADLPAFASRLALPDAAFAERVVSGARFASGGNAIAVQMNDKTYVSYVRTGNRIRFYGTDGATLTRDLSQSDSAPAATAMPDVVTTPRDLIRSLAGRDERQEQPVVAVVDLSVFKGKVLAGYLEILKETQAMFRMQKNQIIIQVIGAEEGSALDGIDGALASPDMPRWNVVPDTTEAEIDGPALSYGAESAADGQVLPVDFASLIKHGSAEFRAVREGIVLENSPLQRLLNLNRSADTKVSSREIADALRADVVKTREFLLRIRLNPLAPVDLDQFIRFVQAARLAVSAAA